MNTLSWLIYLAGVINNIGVASFIVTVCSGIIFLALLIFCGAVFVDDIDDRDLPDKEQPQGSKKYMVYKGLIFWRNTFSIIFVISIILSTFTPSSTTVYTIAASEAGETVVKSPEAQELFSDLKTILKNKIKEIGE